MHPWSRALIGLGLSAGLLLSSPSADGAVLSSTTTNWADYTTPMIPATTLGGQWTEPTQPPNPATPIIGPLEIWSEELPHPGGSK